jgi:hypothetical protein
MEFKEIAYRLLKAESSKKKIKPMVEDLKLRDPKLL